MSPSEWSALPMGSIAKYCKIRITPKGFRTSFATAQTASGYSNSNHTLFGVHAIGLNKNYHGKNIEIEQVLDTKPMLVQATRKTKSTTFETILWGQDNNLTEIPMCIGVQRSLPYYWNLTIHRKPAGNLQGEDHNTRTVHWPYLRESITEWDFAGHVNTPVINYEYKFNHGLLKSRESYWGTRNNSSSYGYYGDFNTSVQAMKRDKSGKLINCVNVEQKKNAIKVDSYTDNIEKPFIGHFSNTPKDHEIQPLPYIGIQPIQANTPKVDNDYTNVQAVWLIEKSVASL